MAIGSERKSVASESWQFNRQLVGQKGFQRKNPKSDRFEVKRFHHVEFWCGDAITTARRFGFGLGMTYIAHSDQGTGNYHYASHVLRSGELIFACTAPYSVETSKEGSEVPLRHFDNIEAHEFLKKHGLGVRAIGIEVADAEDAFKAAVSNGAIAVLDPTQLSDDFGKVTLAEVKLYGDVVLRFVSGEYSGPFIPGYEAAKDSPEVSYGLQRLDHAVGNVPELMPVVEYVAGFTGFHEFAEFVAEDVGTVDSGLNSMVLASNNEMILMPINEPTHGTRRKSQIQTYLDQNEGAGLQHLALKTDDIFFTLGEMQKRSHYGGFDFMPKPPKQYYENLPDRIGNILTAEQYKQCEQMGILVDKDDQGVLLQIFTKPLGDRPTIFLEIIQRLCLVEQKDVGSEGGDVSEKKVWTSAEIGGCGGYVEFSDLLRLNYF